MVTTHRVVPTVGVILVLVRLDDSQGQAEFGCELPGLAVFIPVKTLRKCQDANRLIAQNIVCDFEKKRAINTTRIRHKNASTLAKKIHEAIKLFITHWEAGVAVSHGSFDVAEMVTQRRKQVQ